MSEKTEKSVVRGLRDVAAAETKISYVDPNGSLYYFGYNIDDLVGRVIYAEIAYLLIHKKLPNKQELVDFSNQLVVGMNLPDPIIESIKNSPKSCHPMDILRTEVSHLGEYDPDCGDFSDAANFRRATRLIAEVPAIVAAINRIRLKKPILIPKQELGFAQNFLYMFKGDIPDEKET